MADKLAVIKTDCPKELKDKFSKFADKKGETEASLVRKAVIQMMSQEAKK